MRTVTLFPPEEPLWLEMGDSLHSVQVAYEEYGHSDPRWPNTVFICHALTGSSHVARHSADDLAGWWDIMVGGRRPIDTGVFHALCANVIGGCAGTTGPWSTGPHGRPYGPDFPQVTIGDMVAVHRALLHHLGITRLHSVIGGSMGGMQALEWLLRYPGDADRYLIMASAARLSADGLAAHAVGRAAIRADQDFARGRYAWDPASRGPVNGLGVARMIAHLTYMSAESLEDKFSRRRQRVPGMTGPARGSYAVERYLEHQAGTFVGRFDANSYLHLIEAMDWYDAFAMPHRITSSERPDVHLFSFASDRLFREPEIWDLIQRLAEIRVSLTHYHDESSVAGHDAFLLHVPAYLNAVSGLFSAPLPTCTRRGLGYG